MKKGDRRYYIKKRLELRNNPFFFIACLKSDQIVCLLPMVKNKYCHANDINPSFIDQIPFLLFIFYKSMACGKTADIFDSLMVSWEILSHIYDILVTYQIDHLLHGDEQCL